MKHIQWFNTTQERDEFFSSESLYVTSITCGGNIYEYNGFLDSYYHSWYCPDNNITLISLVRNPGIGTWNPATGTGAYLDEDYNYGLNLSEAPYEITARTAIPNQSDKYYEYPVTSVTELKAIKAHCPNSGKEEWYDYVGEFDVENGVAT